MRTASTWHPCRLRGLARCGAVVLCLLALSSGTAAAQTGPNTDEPGTLRVGPIGIRPRLAFTNVGIDNNVFNSSTDPKRDFTLTASPDVEFTVNPGRLRLSSVFGGDYVYFRKYSSERSVNRSLVARAELDLAFARPFVSVGANNTSARPNSEVDVRGRHHPRAYSGGSSFKLTPLTSLGVAIRRTTERFDEGTIFRDVDISTTLNNTTTAYEASLGLQLTTLTAFSIVASREQTRFTSSPLRDSDTLRIAPTVAFTPGGVLTGSASVGYRHFRGKDSSLSNYTGLVAVGTVGAALADRVRVDSNFARDVRYSYEQDLPYYLLTGGRVTVTTALAGGFDVRLTGGRDVMRYQPFAGSEAPGRDDMRIYGGGVGYRWTAMAQLVVQAEVVDRRSARDPSREFSNNRIFASLNWGVLTR